MVGESLGFKTSLHGSSREGTGGFLLERGQCLQQEPKTFLFCIFFLHN